jgi:hypothetical protein
MNFSVPKEFNVMCWHWTVQRADLQDKDGYTDTETLIIYLDKNLTGARLLQTFFHELIHVLDFADGVVGAGGDLNDNHEKVDRMGSMMAQIISSSKGKL